MKAEELQIGNWVYIEHNEDGLAPYRETTRWTKDDFGFSDEFIETHVFPIPIINEILEKNGFVNIDNDENPYGRDIYWMTGDGYSINTQDLNLHFVHQLQQAMRLCGIDKDIELP